MKMATADAILLTCRNPEGVTRCARRRRARKAPNMRSYVCSRRGFFACRKNTSRAVDSRRGRTRNRAKRKP